MGDYAGSELFLIEGDSLLLHAFSDPTIDFQCEYCATFSADKANVTNSWVPAPSCCSLPGEVSPKSNYSEVQLSHRLF